MLPPLHDGEGAKTDMLKGLLRRPAAQAWLAAVLGRYLAFALRTTRWTLYGGEDLAPFTAGAAVVAAFWHERLPLMPALWTLTQTGAPERRPHVLISRHSDGRFISQILQRFGVAAVHGSSRRNGRDRGGAAGVLALLDVLEQGGIAVITPDGPRGPRRQAAAGVAQLAAVSGAPVLPCAAQIRRRITLGTWDRMIMPLPWGTGVLVCGPAIPVPRENWQESLPAVAAALDDAAATADKLCG